MHSSFSWLHTVRLPQIDIVWLGYMCGGPRPPRSFYTSKFLWRVRRLRRFAQQIIHASVNPALCFETVSNRILKNVNYKQNFVREAHGR
jgi:hypothetical protein